MTKDNSNLATADQAAPQDLISALLAESQELTAIERFAKLHDDGDVPAQAKHYRDLIPLTQPAAGQQYAFEVDLDACSGCKACVSACHHLNGLETGETWRSVGMLHGQNGLPIIQHVTTACHHCVDPGCLKGCPTNAYEKDPVTGIVRHLDDQCFGCQYCTMACPYEVPQYSHAKGIVRKCDMCHGRLAAGEAPACVQACPNGAIRISIVDTLETVERTTQGVFLPATPPAELTNPTTIYRGQHKLPVDLQAGDSDTAKPQHAHLPLVIMLVLTQLSVGGLAVGAIARWLGAGTAAEAAIVSAVVIGLLGLNAATLHLGRPHLAFRAILGWRHSWLSREALVFGVYAPLALTVIAFTLVPLVAGWLPGFVNSLLAAVLQPALRPILEVTAALVGAAGVYCSIRLYQFTGRKFWLGLRTLGKFAGTAVVTGLALLLATMTIFKTPGVSAVASLLLPAMIVKLAYELTLFRHTRVSNKVLWLSGQLMQQELRTLAIIRFAIGAIGGIVLPILVMVSPSGSVLSAMFAAAAFVCVTVGELFERALFFSAVVPLKMPGGIKP
ncbi:dimethyl sulfoxide reductase anchor subunit [Aeoliella sp. ICT_H6.2]|uniref:Dimethyl sulfoxide reductase anchor subunit n=1 Tax=Aeoliella straminimaris TaxID=2954799 RepID=A0A9X2FH36_9BACT|nr:DmsC/YnfH family molybdoenzyme membrane anchor subunit [Aeoliella straminimaris]MCO6045591.1 dimethyl sulfoxide reductase anchor subunit [Aeoliella straminimaris]